MAVRLLAHFHFYLYWSYTKAYDVIIAGTCLVIIAIHNRNLQELPQRYLRFWKSVLGSSLFIYSKDVNNLVIQRKTFSNYSLWCLCGLHWIVFHCGISMCFRQFKAKVYRFVEQNVLLIAKLRVWAEKFSKYLRRSDAIVVKVWRHGFQFSLFIRELFLSIMVNWQ